MKQSSGFRIAGRVIHGDDYGKVLGFPTANLDRRQFMRLKAKPKFGVWAGTATFKTSRSNIKNYPAAIVIGPIDKTGRPKIEAHVLGFSGSLYGIYLNIYLNRYLRPFKKFSGIQALKRQIAKDIKQITKLTHG